MRARRRRDRGHEVHAKPLPVVCSYTWFQSGGSAGEGGATIPWGTLVDGQSVLMLVVVTFISFLVHIFSTDYVAATAATPTTSPSFRCSPPRCSSTWYRRRRCR